MCILKETLISRTTCPVILKIYLKLSHISGRLKIVQTMTIKAKEGLQCGSIVMGKNLSIYKGENGGHLDIIGLAGSSCI